MSRLWLWNETAKHQKNRRKFAQTKEIAVLKIKRKDNVDLFFYSKIIVHQEFIPEDYTANEEFCQSCLDRFIKIITCTRSNLWKYQFFFLFNKYIYSFCNDQHSVFNEKNDSSAISFTH